jgi:hypothetical protein
MISEIITLLFIGLSLVIPVIGVIFLVIIPYYEKEMRKDPFIFHRAKKEKIDMKEEYYY